MSSKMGSCGDGRTGGGLVSSPPCTEVSHVTLSITQAGAEIDHDTKAHSHQVTCSAWQYGYRMSKAALNNAGATLARDLSNDDIAVGLIHPGPVSHPGHLAAGSSLHYPLHSQIVMLQLSLCINRFDVMCMSGTY
jgi:NAD(P)-dependent dehydrogenase (short-subunit alcohol dehydrogenase family)